MWDIGVDSLCVLDSLASKVSVNQKLGFGQVVPAKMEQYQVSRLFASSLQLANFGNISIEGFYYFLFLCLKNKRQWS